MIVAWDGYCLGKDPIGGKEARHGWEMMFVSASVWEMTGVSF